MHETTCPCGAQVLGHQRFCAACGSPAPKLPAPLEQWEPLDAHLERLLRKVMVDIDDGHLGLWLEPGHVVPDRQVPAALTRIDWPLVLQQRGWVRPIPGTQARLWPTDAGRAVVAAARADRDR